MFGAGQHVCSGLDPVRTVCAAAGRSRKGWTSFLLRHVSRFLTCWVSLQAIECYLEGVALDQGSGHALILSALAYFADGQPELV